MLHKLPKINLKLAGKNYQLYVAGDSRSQRQGLSDVDQLSDSEGMIFVYDDDKPRTFQFRDTLLPLTIYFISKDGKVVKRSSASPGQLDKISCKIPCRWVIEVVGGDS